MNKKEPIDWIDTLKKFINAKQQRTAQEIDDETDQLFLKYIEQAKSKEEEQDKSYKKIPKFFQKALLNENQLSFRVRQEARTRFLHHKTSEILDKEGAYPHQLSRLPHLPPTRAQAPPPSFFNQGQRVTICP